MADESKALVLRPEPVAPSENDYQALIAALDESARGRWFLSEYSRRNRSADTEVLLTALDRIEARIDSDAKALARFRDELCVLLIAIRLARPDIAAADTPEKAAKLASLVDLLERRINAMLEPGAVPLAVEAAGVAAEAAESSGADHSAAAPPEEAEAPAPAPMNAEPCPAMVEAPAVAPASPPPAAENDLLELPPADPLAAIMALSEVERIALFT